jgi:hypothetical protein
MKSLQTSSRESSLPNGRNGNALSILSLQTIASDLLEKADDADFVRGKARELFHIAEQAFDVLAFVGSNLERLEPQSTESQ